MTRRQTLKEALQSWQDPDGAAFDLGVCLGLWEDSQAAFLANKGVFWADNALGNCLTAMLDQLVAVGLLERNDDDQYRWVDTGPPALE